MITAPGLYDLPAEAYHADPCPVPSLSASIAKVLLADSPRHAWVRHPRLNPDHEAENRTIFDLGKTAHKLVLGKGDEIVIIDAPDWRTAAAKAERDAAWNVGRIPLLAKDYERAEAMAAAVRAQLDRHEDAAEAFRPGAGRPEVTMIWREGEAWCRSMLDWQPSGGNVFYDFKTTGASAHPDQFARRSLFELGYDLQAAFYARGIKALLGIAPIHFRFVVVEADPPHALSVIEPTPAAMAMADRKVEQALGWWRWCLEHDRWPGYPARTAYVDPPPWHERDWTEREDREAMLTEAGEDIRQVLLDWQAPHKEAAE